MCLGWLTLRTPSRATGSRFNPAAAAASPGKALPEPLDVSCRVLVAVQDEPAMGADVRTDGEALLYPFPTAAAVLAGVRWRDRYDSLAGPFCLAGEDCTERIPPSVVDRLIEAGLGARRVMLVSAVAVRLGFWPAVHIGYLEVFQIDRVVRSHQTKRRLVVKISALPLDFLMLLRQYLCGFATALAALLATADPTLGLLESFLCPAVVAGILDGVALSRDQKHLESNINTRLLPSARQNLCGHIRAGELHVPAVRLVANGDGLDGALNRAAPVDVDAADLGQHQRAIIESGAVAIFLVGEGVPAVASLEPWEAGFLAALDPVEERWIGLVQPRQHILQHVGMDCGVLGKRLADTRQFRFLGEAFHGHVAAFPGGLALLERHIVEGAAAPENHVQRPLLFGRRPEFLFERLAHRLCHLRLPSRLRIDVALNGFLAHVTRCTSEIRPGPRGGQLEECRKLLAEMKRRDPLALLHDERSAIAWPYPHKQVDVI